VSGRWKLPLAVAVAVLVIAAIAIGIRLRPPRSEPQALALMARAAGALDEVPVRGVVETIVETPTGPLEIRAEVHRGRGRAHIKYLSGPRAGAEVFKQAGQVWAKAPDGRVRRGGPCRDIAWQDTLIERNYRARLGARGTMLGRPVTYVTSEGPAGLLNLAVDEATGFPLLMTRRGPARGMAMSTLYSEVDFSVSAPPEMEPPAEAAVGPLQGEQALTPEELQRRVGFRLLAPTYLPRGFQLQGYYLRERRHRKLAEIRYADGLRVLLVVETRMPGRGPGPMAGRGRRHRGPMEVMRAWQGHAARRLVGDTTVIVIGSLPSKELARVADSVRPLLRSSL